MHCLPMAPPSTWWTTSVWPCLCISEKSVCTPYTYMTGRNHLGFQLAMYAKIRGHPYKEVREYPYKKVKQYPYNHIRK